MLLAALAQPVVSALPSLVPGFSRPIGEVSDKFDTFIVPAGYAFAIWGLIFALCLLVGVLQLRSRPQTNQVFAAIRPALLVAMLGNCAWMIAFPLEIPWLPLVLIWVILLALLKGLKNLSDLPITGWQARTTQALMSIFAGWLSVAAFANIALAALESGWLPNQLRGAWDAATLAGRSRADTGSQQTRIWQLAVYRRHRLGHTGHSHQTMAAPRISSNRLRPAGVDIAGNSGGANVVAESAAQRINALDRRRLLTHVGLKRVWKP